MSTAAAELRYHHPSVRDVLGRSDYAIISQLIEPNTRVLDVGCGEGELLHWLALHKRVDARGVEIVGSKVQRAIARGVSVYQGDIDQGLADYPDDAFDYVILSQTLQEVRKPLKVLKEMLRVGKRAIVAFPNFGHWTVRLAHLWSGRAPQHETIPARLVRLAQYPFPHRSRLRGARAKSNGRWSGPFISADDKDSQASRIYGRGRRIRRTQIKRPALPCRKAGRS